MREPLSAALDDEPGPRAELDWDDRERLWPLVTALSANVEDEDDVGLGNELGRAHP